MAARTAGPCDLGPLPIKVFMRIPIQHDGRLRWLPAGTRPDDGITFRAILAGHLSRRPDGPCS
jgi:hypothetical protein